MKGGGGDRSVDPDLEPGRPNNSRLAVDIGEDFPKSPIERRVLGPIFGTES